MKKRLYQFVAIALLSSVVILLSCEKNKEDSSPVLPPMSAFAIDVDDFTSEGQMKSIDSMSNYHMVVGAVYYWNTVLSFSMAVPVLAYAEAFNHKAERIDNDTWQWEYSVNDMYSAKLVADVANDSIYLNMKITKTGEYVDLVWYTGKCDILRTGGEWTVFDIPDDHSTAWLAIEWNANYGNKTFDIRYTSVKPETDYVNSYIEYGITTDTDYNAYYNLYNSNLGVTYEVNYNTETHVGTVTDGMNQLCWDEELTNCLCPLNR